MKTYVSLVGLLLLMAGGLIGADNVLTPQEKAQGWVLLFDGKTLNGWDPTVPEAARAGRGGGTPAPAQAKAGRKKAAAPKAPAAEALPSQGSNPRPCTTAIGKAPLPPDAAHWDIIDGALSGCGDVAGYLNSKQDFKDLQLKVDFKTGRDTNSGIFVRAPGGNMGYEVQIWRIQPAGYNTGSIVNAGKTDREYNFIPDQWNTYDITADGDHLVVILNGTKTLDVHDSQFSNGRIVLQYQKFPIEFKNIKVRVIKH